jgi:hypothetical protein
MLTALCVVGMFETSSNFFLLSVPAKTCPLQAQREIDSTVKEIKEKI